MKISDFREKSIRFDTQHTTKKQCDEKSLTVSFFVKKHRAESRNLNFAQPAFRKRKRGNKTLLVVGFKPQPTPLLSCFVVRTTRETSKSYQMILQYINALNASTKWRVVLASKSPRRQEILRNLGIEFDVVASTFEENISKEGVKGHEYAICTAREKAKEVYHRTTREEQEQKKKSNLIVISADTVVESFGNILEKPRDIQDARAMMEKHSNNSHKVHTGVCIAYNTNEKTTPELKHFSETTVVNFAEIERKEVDAFLATNEWTDKAGGYGIQGYASSFVKGIEGDYFNVVGFPVHAFSRELKIILDEIGIDSM